MPLMVTKNEAIPAIAKREKVAAYARVSCGKDAMLHSLSTQVSSYNQLIRQNPAWEYAGVYADEAKTGTKESRPEFQRLLADCRAGKINMVITKSISRFARNTVDSLKTICDMKKAGCEVYFEKENIYTFDGKGELLLTIMSSLAQEESRSISENVTWGLRKRFADGKVTMAYSQFLGYEKGPDGKPVINEKEAEIIRLIYRLYLEGKTPFGIKDALETAGVLSPSGKSKWSVTTINSILRNEKYKGDALLQKFFTVDYLTKTMKPNQGELPSYYVRESHPAIISADEFDMVQAEIERRSHRGRGYSGNSIFSSKLFCGDCGGMYGAKVWHSNDAYRRVIWQCNRKFSKKQEQCKTPHLSEDTIKRMFLKAYNRLMKQRKQLIEDCELMKSLLTDCTEQEAGMEQLHREIKEIAEMTQNLVRQNTRLSQSQDAYNAKYDALVERYEKASAKHDKLKADVAKHKSKAQQMTAFIEQLKNAPETLDEWDNRIRSLLPEKGTVNRDGSIVFEFRNGKGIRVEAKCASTFFHAILHSEIYTGY